MQLSFSRERILTSIVLVALSTATGPLQAQDSARVHRDTLAVAAFDLPPFHTLSPSGTPSGFAIDVVEAVARRVGMQVRYVPMPSSEAAQEALSAGVVDVLPSMGIIASRDPRMDFTVPVHSTEIRIFVKAGTSEIEDLDDLAGHTVAVVERNVGLDIVRPLRRVSARVYDTNSAALMALIAGNADAMIYPESMFWNLAIDLGVQDLVESTGVPLREVTRGLAVREGNDSLRARLNPAIDALLTDDEYADIVARWSFQPPRFWTMDRVLTWVGVVLLSLVVGHYVRVRRLNQRLVRSKGQLRALATHLQTVREDERKTLARELHDEIAHAMTVLKMELDFLRSPDLAQDFMAERLDEMSALTDSAISAGHRICTRLRPGLLDDLGLEAAVDWVIEDFETRTGMRCSLEVLGSDAEIDDDVSTALFRILQEALINVIRHAGARSVTIRLDLRGDPLRLLVEDDGRGVKPEDLDGPTSLGVLGMQERAGALGGTVEIGAGADRGTRLRASIPHPGVGAG